ncbi:Periplasmic protein TorT [compost metagenome]
MKMFGYGFKRFPAVLGAVLAAMAVLGIGMNAATAAEADRLKGLVEPLKADKPFTLGVTLVHLQDDFWKGIAYGIQDEAKRSGVNVLQVSVAGAYGNVREQFAQLESLKARGADYVVVGAASFDGYDAMFKNLQEGGTKVLAAGIPVNSPNVAFGVGQDEGAIGIALAKALCAVKPNSTTLPIPGPAGAEWARLRFEAFQGEAKKCPGMTVKPGAFGGSLDLAYGMSQASDLLLRDPGADFIYTPVISLGMGAVQAVRQQRKNVKVVSSAIVREAIPLVKDGRMLAVASEPGILMGRLIVQYAIRDREGKPMPNMVKDGSLKYPHLLTPPVVITPENVSKYAFDEYDIPPKGWNITSSQ